MLKTVTFFLFEYVSGSVADHDDEVESAPAGCRWTEAPRLLSYKGEAGMAAKALEAVAK